MIKETLKYLYIENFSIVETAHRMNISSEKLKEMIQTMEHMGYVRAISEEESTACSGCMSCKRTLTCHTDGSSIAGKKLVLTEKGQRLCNKL